MDNNNQFGNNNSNPPENQNNGNNSSLLYNYDISGNPFIRNNPQNTGTNVNNYPPYRQNIPNNYNNNNYIPPQNNYNEPFNRQYADAPVKKSSKGIYIVLIGVIICFAVIICLMFTLMRSMIDGGNKKPDSTDNNLFVSEVTSTGEPDIPTATTEIKQTAVPAVTEIAPEVVTVTVIVTVTEPVKQEPSFQPYQYKVNNVGLVVYANAGFDSKPIDYISDRGTYTIVDQYQNWGKLESGGWINFDVASEKGGVTYIGIGEVVTQKDPLNMRSAPDSDAKIITSIPKGTSVGIYESEFPDWYYVDYNGKSGFVSTKYISFDNFHVTTIIDDCGYGTVATKKDPLNLRSEASENSSILTTIPKGTSIKLYSTIYDGWYSTSYNGKVGYVKAEYISFSDSYQSTPSSTDNVNILEYYGPGVVATKKDPLNVRSEPSTNASVVTTIPRHTTIDLYMTTYDGWFYTTYNGKSGYVSAQYISNVVPSDDVTSLSTAYINTKSDPLNLRKSASKNGDIITTIPKGTAVTVIEYGDSWCYVEWNGYKGYASTDYLLF